MRLSAPGQPHLTYCTNIHPGESWPEVRENLRTYLPKVKQRVCPDSPFGVGLRLSARAARELLEGDELLALRGWLDENDLYVFTLNGFPYGAFHGQSVKEAVYRPDWLEAPRLAYTRDLIAVLAELLPDGVDGSISTVPVSFARRVRDESAARRAALALTTLAGDLAELSERRKKHIELGLEPEPACFVETTADAVRFFDEELRSSEVVDALGRARGVPRHRAADWIDRHLGVCLDTCHAAVQFEDPDDTIARLRSASIRIGKIQVTAGLSLEASDARVTELSRFDDGVYLHQVVAADGDELRRYVDLPDALTGAPRGVPWRVHFHVPVFAERLARFESTQPYVARILDLAKEQALTSHLEVETYTWNVLPEEHRSLPVETAIARELDWTRARLAASQENPQQDALAR